jgi:hypothetical protein
MDDLDLDLQATEPGFRAERTAPIPALTPVPIDPRHLFTPLPMDLVLPALPPLEEVGDVATPREPDRDEPHPSLELTVTETAFRPSASAPAADTGSHSNTTPSGPDLVGPPPPPERRRRDVALPKLRESIRSPDEVARARGERRGPGNGRPLVIGVVAIVTAFAAAVPLVVWLALSQQPAGATTPAAGAPAQDELMGIPVRRDLKLPKE